MLKERSGHKMIPKDNQRAEEMPIRMSDKAAKALTECWLLREGLVMAIIYLQVHQTHCHHKLEPKDEAEEENVFCAKLQQSQSRRTHSWW